MVDEPRDDCKEQRESEWSGGVVVLGAQADGLGCDSPSSDPRFDSTVGTTHFRWWPLGVECVYTRTENGVDRRDEPGPVPSGWALSSVVLSIAVVRSFRATRRNTRLMSVVSSRS